MKYYLGSDTDPLFAVYEREGVCYPVFAEKYGTEGFPFRDGMQEITDEETVAALDKYMNPYEDGKTPVYMAGPLFNEGDRISAIPTACARWGIRRFCRRRSSLRTRAASWSRRAASIWT